MQNKIHKIIIVLSLLSVPLFSSEKKFSIGIGYPYISLKHRLMKQLSVELRYATGKKINVYTTRLYYNWYTKKKLFGYSGLEFGYLTFEREEFKGDGFIQAIFTGSEYFIKPQLSLMTDIGISFISLETDFRRTTISTQGFEIIYNLGFNIYF